MNPPIFLYFMVGEDPQNCVYKFFNAMGMSSKEKAELASYELMDLAQVWYTQWKYNKRVEADLIK